MSMNLFTSASNEGVSTGILLTQYPASLRFTLSTTFDVTKIVPLNGGSFTANIESATDPGGPWHYVGSFFGTLPSSPATISRVFGVDKYVRCSWSRKGAADATFQIALDADVPEAAIVYAPDSDHTYSMGFGGLAPDTLIVWGSGITGAHTIKFNNAIEEGIRLRLVNYSVHDMTLQNSGGGALLAAPLLPAINGSFRPGLVQLTWLNNGAYTGWSEA
jgi:hypothetical protein